MPTLSEINDNIAKLVIERNLLLQKSLSSADPEAIIKAQRYLEQTAKQTEGGKAFVFAPDDTGKRGFEFKENVLQGISYEMLRHMAKTPVIRAIIGTRIEQVINFSKPVADNKQIGWTIKPKKRVFDDEKPMNKKQIERAEDIIEFLQNCGVHSRNWQGDTFEGFLRQITKDSLELDQSTFEIVRNKKNDIVEFFATDAATFRFLDDDSKEQFGQKPAPNNGFQYFPEYAQVWRQQVKNIFYPWELGFGIRNASTNVLQNGYGMSELEDLIQIITWMLWGMQYNGNFFRQGSNPRGYWKVKGNFDPAKILEFKQGWRSTVAGVDNAHRSPVIEGDMDWVDMQSSSSNKDMEFGSWQEFLMVLAHSVYRIDPSETGFSLQKQAQIFGQDGQEARLTHSKEKGLKPLLKHLQHQVNRYIVSQLDPEFEFCFTGIDLEDEFKKVDIDSKRLQFTRLNDILVSNGQKPIKGADDLILNPVYMQYMQMQQMGGQESNEAMDNMTGEPEGNMYEESPFNKVQKSDPYMDELNSYIDRYMTK